MAMMSWMLALAMAANADPSEARAAEAQRAWQQLGVQVEHDGSPRERALLSRAPSLTLASADESGRVLRAAAQKTPADELVQWFWATSPDSLSGCTPRDPCPERILAIARLQPDNAAAWGPVFDAAWQRKDQAAIDEALGHMARASHFDEPFADVVSAWRKLLARHPLPASYYETASPYRNGRAVPREETEAIVAVAFAAAMVLPIHGLYEACNQETLPAPSPDRLEGCRRVAALMIESGTMIQRSIGTGLMKRAGGAPPADFPRQQEWWMSLHFSFENDSRESLRYFDDLASTGSEIRALELALQRAGKPLTPPADWVYVSPFAVPKQE